MRSRSTVRHPIIAAAVFALTASLDAAAQAQSVSGQFTLAGKPLKPTHVAAFRVRDQRAPRSMQTYVMLTLAPVDVEAIRTALDPYATSINDKAVLTSDNIAVYVSADGQVHFNAHVGDTQYLDSSAAMMGVPGSLAATCGENTAARVACTVKTTRPVKPMDGPTWTLDVSFASPIATRTPGTVMSPDGGVAGQELLALVGAVGGKDLSKIVALLAPGQAKSYQETWRTPAENLASAKDILSVRLPKQPKITGGELWAEDHAVLEVEGTPFPDSKTLYLVEMQRIDGHWKYANSVPAGSLR